MMLDEITIRNFGIYQDTGPLDLTTTKKQPIVLFGGLNGGGKTTLLDAILLCLYGPLAKTSNRGSSAYPAYLRDSLNRHTKEKDAYIELRFRHHRDGRMDSFLICRRWKVGKTVQESVRVEVNGKEDQHLQENWLNFIDELIPAQVANLFFFDGEKIEQFADLENAQSLLEAALHSLLGLDVLNQLNVDLRTLEQRKKVALRSAEEQQELKAEQERLEVLEQGISKNTHLLGAARTDLQLVRANLVKAKRKYSRGGGMLFEQREELYEAKARLKRELKDAKDAFVVIASTESPLLLVEELIEGVVQQADRESAAKDAEKVLSMLVRRDKKTLATVKKTAGEKARAIVARQLERDRGRHQNAAEVERYLELTDEGLKLAHRAHSILPTVGQSFKAIVGTIAELEEKLEHADKKIQSIPDSEAVKRLRKECERWEEEEQQLLARISLLEEDGQTQRNRVDTARSVLFNRLESDVNAQFLREDDKRVIEYAERARTTLETLKQKVIDRRLHEIEALILESFKKLIRKRKLIGGVRISPVDYSLGLLDGKGKEIHPSRLSAGERQLLAVAILWGLAKAAGLPLPVVIDTPLGRLDGEHRNRLLTAYFPKASHQVLILSTDTEIAKQYYAKLKPSIKRSYQIEYDPASHSSRINEGYQFT
jgi:DNA sulfur modification protein DndD